MDGVSVSEAGATETYRFRYHGDGTAFFLLILKNVLLTVLTLGIYAAWAKTARRKFIWSNLEVHGQRLEYTGTGRELFIGYLKVGVVYLLIAGVPAIVRSISPKAQALTQVLTGIAIMLLVPFAIYWSRRYLLSRTSWRGIRLGLAGAAAPYARQFWLGTLLTILTLGIYGPFLSNQLRATMTNNSRLGDEPFLYDGKGSELFWLSVKGLLLTIVTLGIYYSWFLASLQRYVFAHTGIGQARGLFTLTGGDIFVILLLNVFGTTLTLGIAFPWIVTYTLKRVCENIRFEGRIDFSRVSQRAPSGNAAADGLAGALGIELGV